MPETEQDRVVLDLNSGVTQEQYQASLEGMRDALEAWRRNDGNTRYCMAMWTWFQNHVSPAFNHNDYFGDLRDLTLYYGNVNTDEDRARELREIRGRLLSQVGERTELQSVNTILRAAGLPEYTPEGTPRWGVRTPSLQLIVNADADPRPAIREAFQAFLTGIGDSDAEYHAGILTTWPEESQMVPVADTVPLLR